LLQYLSILLPTCTYCTVYIHLNTPSLHKHTLQIQYLSVKYIVVVIFIELEKLENKNSNKKNRQISEKKWEYKKQFISYLLTSRRLVIQLGREILYNILIEFGIHMKLARLIKLCLKETCSRLRVGRNYLTYILIKWSEKRNDFSSLLSSLVLYYTLRKVQVNHYSLKLNGTYQLMVYVDYVNIL